MNKTRRPSQRRNRKGLAIVEFALSLFVALLVVFGVINLIMISASIAGAYLITTYSAIQASTQTTYDRALASATSNCTQLMHSGFASWVKMKPVGGFGNSGMNLYVEQRNQDTSFAQTVGPNTPVSAPIDTAKNVYEYMTDCTYEVGPFVDMAGFAGLNQVPFIGKAARLHCTASRAVEHPEGLAGYGTLTSIARAFNGVLPKGFVIDTNGDAHWTNPGDEITQPGSGVSYILVNDPNGAGAYLLQVTLSHDPHQVVSGENLEFIIEFHGIHLTPSGNGMVSQLESFTAHDANGHATSYTVDPGQEIGIRNTLSSTWGKYSDGFSSTIAVQHLVQNLNYTQGAGFLPAVEAGWNHFSNWYSQLQIHSEWRNPTDLDMYATNGIVISSPGRVNGTPIPQVTLPGIEANSFVLSGPLNNNSLNVEDGKGVMRIIQPLNNNTLNTDYGVAPTAVSAAQIGVAGRP